MSKNSPHSLRLGIPGFTFEGLHDPAQLRKLTEVFCAEVAAQDSGLGAELRQYLAARGEGWDRAREAPLLLGVAPILSSFVARLFGVVEERRELLSQGPAFEPVARFKKEIVARRAMKARGAAAGADLLALARDMAVIEEAIEGRARPGDDLELRRATAAGKLLDWEAVLGASGAPSRRVEEALGEVARLQPLLGRWAVQGTGPAAGLQFVKQLLQVFELWAARVLLDEESRRQTAVEWVSFRLPEKLDFPDHLVHAVRPDPALPELLRGEDRHLRRREGFKLTDPRWSTREALDHAHYCLLCHDREKDSCSRGYPHPRKEAAPQKNPLGVALGGCPLEERISEMHALARTGDALAALAVAMVDNPMCAATGHRICNDCMKACIFQKQEPVNIPQIETRCLTSVLDLPYGAEIYGLLTRWNPLNARRPQALPYNGRNVLVVGLGPAGINLVHWLLNEGFGVVGIDGLKIEPLPPELGAGPGLSPRPVRDFSTVKSSLDERIGGGFGGVAEYGITVRWDKNFLTLLHMTLLRRDKLRVHGGVRFGGTIELDDAWKLGIDHVAIAAGAGKPTVVEMKNTLARNIRTASDFLMGLQLTGAYKRNSLANLQLELPAIVIGSGLTAIDTATEALAYYPIQVERTLDRYEQLCKDHGEEEVVRGLRPRDLATLRTFLDHGRAIRAERARAQEAGELPSFIPLLRSWGGVKICYRKRLQDSPAYRLNHEEIVKCFEEGVDFVENVNPVEALQDETGAVRGVVFERVGKVPEGQSKTIDFAARTVFLAAGTSPNIIYEREHPGTFLVDAKRRSFLPHRVRQEGGKVVLEPAQGTLEDPGFFTSYEQQGRLVTFFGDNHPVFAGSVVKAMASARRGYLEIVKLFQDAVDRAAAGGDPSLEGRWCEVTARLDDELVARVVEVVRLTPTVVEVVVRAPLAARKFQPGQFYRLQNYERSALEVEGTRLAMEGLALTGAWVDRAKGLLSMIVLEMGGSSNLCQLLRKGEEVVVMGPTGAPTEIPDAGLVVLCGGGLGNAVLFSVAQALRGAGCRVVYFAGYKKAEDLFHQEDIERGCDQVIWSVDRGESIAPRRPQDLSFVGNIVESIRSYAEGKLGARPKFDLREARRMISIGSDRMMAAVNQARHGTLSAFFHPEVVSISSINSPMQCMMKEICGQCLQRHIDPAGAAPPTYVFTCFNQDQCSDQVDWSHLRERLEMNGVQERLTSLWLRRLLARRGLAVTR